MSAIYSNIPTLQGAAAKITAALLLFCTAATGQDASLLSADGATPNVVVRNQTAVKVIMKQQADLSGAFQLSSKEQKAQYVYNALLATAQQGQSSILQAVNQMGLITTSYYIADFILVQAPAGQTISTSQLQSISARTDVALVETVNSYNTNLPAPSAPAATTLSPGRGIEKNLQFINAPQAWAQGAQGQGVTIGIVDSGVQWNHPLLKTHYRGFLGTGGNHNYNWWDAVHQTLTGGANPCGINLTAPCDDLGHGTHVTGTAVGGNNKDYQIGVAPKARFIACRDMDRGWVSSGATFEECMQFMLAPWDLTGQNADPTKSPDIVVSPYHCYVSGASCLDDPLMHTVFWNLYAAGITSVVAAGDSGPLCGSVTNWPQAYPVALITGALDYDAASGSPTTTAAPFSFSGPGSPSMIFRPDISLPGSNILSAVPGGNVALMSSTSSAAGQLAGAIALVQSLRPNAQGHPELFWRLVGASPSQAVAAGTCGSSVPTPNYVYGWGTTDVNLMLAQSPVQ